MERILRTFFVRTKVLAFLLLLSTASSFAQTPLPFELKNTSDYSDDKLFVAIVGIANGRHVWIDMKNGQVKDMSPSYNTVQGPVYNGNKGPGQNAMYANCFTKLSDIPNKKINLTGIGGCRVFISVEKQLYFYFFGATGAQTGYTSPSHTDPTDPNTGIKYEIIELTYDQIGIWINTTRVDSYQYPMGLELTNTSGAVQKTGELKSHAEIGAAFKASVPEAFQSCYDSKSGSILFPTKTVAWADGSIGTMPNRGPYVDYMKSYIDQVWAKYKNEDLIFNSGDAGIFKGRISGEQLTMTCISGGFAGRTGIVQNRPTTQEAFEGKGVLDRRIGDGTVDLVVQAQLCAAFTRHLINVTTPNVGQQNWSDKSKYYLEGPCNSYAKFWHRDDISLNGKSYGFAYDDVYDQSSTLHSPNPKSVLILFGGYAKNTPTNPPVTPSTTGLITTYNDCNMAGSSAGLSVGNYTLAQLQALGVADNSVSSLKITQGYKAILFDGDNFTGASTTLTADNACLVAAGWNDITSSIQIRTAGVTNISGTFYLRNRNSNLNMDVTGGTGALNDGAKMQQWNNATTTNQQFKFEHVADGAYKITAVHSGKAMDVDGISKDDGARIHQWGYVGGDNQQFIVVATDAVDTYKLIAKHSGKVVEVAGASTAIEAPVQQWTNNNQTCGQWKFISIVGTNPPNGTGTGLTGNYFNGMNFETPVFNRTDATINVDWGNGSPNAAVNADGFSARWSGQVQPKYSGEYTFYVNSDNGRRLWINNQLVIDKWIDDWNIDYSGKITLTAGQKYDIKLEYFENYGGAGCKLEWSHASQQREVIPQTQLYVNTLPAVSLTSPSTGNSFAAPATVTINANASDAASIAKVEFYNGGTKLGEDNTAPYSFSWGNVGVGSYTITARATDNLGGITASSPVTFSVTTTTTTNKAPTITLTSPASGSSFNAPATVTIAATAADADGTVSRVEFYNGATKVGEDMSSPYSFSISLGAGSYAISAKAFDNSGASATSSTATITVVTVATDQCAGIPAYVENGGYAAGSKAKNAGKRYECKEFPYSGWCNGAAWAYAPGTGAYWSDAWYEKGSCAGRQESTTFSSSNEAVLVSPNPASDRITIHVTSTATVTVLNSQGIEVISATSVASQESLNISALPAGIYLVRIDTGSDVATRTIIKN